MATIDVRYVESRFPKIVPGGEDLNITHIFRNVGDSGRFRIEMTRAGEKTTREFDLGAGDEYSITEKLPMPWDDAVYSYVADLFGYIVKRVRRRRCTSHSQPTYKGVTLGVVYCTNWEYYYQTIRYWEKLHHLAFSLPIEACFPNLNLLNIDAPREVCAGETYRVPMTVVNTGCGGQTRLKDTDTVIDERRRESGEEKVFTLTREMPYGDIWLFLTAEVLGRDKEWITTADIPSEIKAAFAKSEIGAFDYPKGLRAGEGFSMSVPVRNVGCRGETGLRIFDGETEVERVERIDRGAYITPTFSSEMPPVSVLRMRLNSIHLGRDGEVVIDDTKTIEMRLVNTLDQLEKAVKMYGGYAERNTFAGFVAGKNVKISGIPTVPGTGGPLGGLIPYGGYIISGDLGPGDIATIEFDELYFLRVETVKGIATIRASRLLERDTKIYEYSVTPTPAMMFQPVNLLTTSLRKVAPRLEIAK